MKLTSHYKETQARNKKSNFRKIINISCKAEKWKDKVPQIFYDIIDKSCDIASNESDIIPSTFKPEYITSFKYPLEGGKLTGHVDVKGNWVVLISLGQSCKFFVRGPKTKGTQKFEFKSGDCLLFNASRKANIYHGIHEVCEDTIPDELKAEYPDLSNWRASVQMRCYTEVPITTKPTKKKTKQNMTSAESNLDSPIDTDATRDDSQASDASIQSNEEDTELQSKGDSMDVDEEEKEKENEDENESEKENKTTERVTNNGNSRKRKSPEKSTSKRSSLSSTSSKPPRKKQRTEPQHQLTIKINNESQTFLVSKLKLIPFFKDEIIENAEDGTYKFKTKKSGKFESNKYVMTDFEILLSYLEETDDDHKYDAVEDLACLEGFIYCCQAFKVKLNVNRLYDEYKELKDDDEKDINNWKDSQCKLLKELYAKIKATNEEKEEEEKEQIETKTDKQIKNRRRSKPKPKKKNILPSTGEEDDDDDDDEETVDDDGDTEVTEKNDSKNKKKAKTETKKKEKKKKRRKPSLEPSKFFILSDDNNHNKKKYESEDDGEDNDDDDDIEMVSNNKKKKKSKRLQHEKFAIMTQQYEGDGNENMMISSDEDEDDDIDDGEDEEKRQKRKQKKLNDAEKDIKRLDDIEDIEAISLLQTMTIRRLCRCHNIDFHKPLTTKQKKEKNKLAKDGKIYRGYKYKDDRVLINKLKDKKKQIDGESNIKTLADVSNVDDIGELQTKTIKRLCKQQKIAANQKVTDMIEMLEERWKHPLDEEDLIETLQEVHIEDIKNYDRDVLVRLCQNHNIPTTTKDTKKKRKKRRRGGNDDSDESESDEEGEDLEDRELIKALEEEKTTMLQQIRKKQQSQISKLEDEQQHIVHIKERDNCLTISGGNAPSESSRSGRHRIHNKRGRSNRNRNKRGQSGDDSDDNNPFNQPMSFKEDVEGLVALCNSEVTKKGNGWTIVDDPLADYNVVISEDGARTIKVMMVIARGGSVVSKKWVNHSIKQQRWLSPQNYEDKFPNWQSAANEARERRVRTPRKRKRTKKGSDDEEETDDDDLDLPASGPLLKDFSIYVQDRRNVANPSALHIKWLAKEAGAQIVDENWTNERLKRKEVDDEEKEEKKVEKKKKKTEKTKSKRGAKRRRGVRDKREDDEDSEDEDGDDNDNDDDEQQDEDEDEDMETTNNSKKNKRKPRNHSKTKKKSPKPKETRIRASRSRRNEDSDGDSDDNEDGGDSKGRGRGGGRRTKLRKYKMIISHPEIYDELKLKKEEKKKIKVVKASWLFDSIEHYKVMGFERKYIVKPHRQSRSPAH